MFLSRQILPPDTYPFPQRYLALKKMVPKEREEVIPRVVIFAGKAAPGCKWAHTMLFFKRLILFRLYGKIGITFIIILNLSRDSNFCRQFD